MRRYLRWIVLVLVVALFLAGAGFIVWANSTPAPLPAAEAAMQSGGAVEVSTENWLVFQPESVEATTGYIFYPGGRVRPEAYAPYAREIAEAGYLVVLVPMPLNLAVLGIERAGEVIAAYPQIDQWAIGGHSLGGSMAARYAFDHPEQIAGLILLASYPEADRDFSGREIAAASIYGSLDGLATVDQVEDTRVLFPADADFVRIEGGNHAQFGWYGEQAGDNPATISREDQQQQTLAGTLAVLEQVAGGE